MRQKINFIFFGRLEKEKGFDLILGLIKLLAKANLLDKVNFYIFGDGTLSEDLQQFANHDSVQFFGRVDRQVINEYLGQSHYALMPSRFLETFGLVALESLSKGVPVIGFAKGGLDKFIPPEFDIYNQKGETELDKLYTIIVHIIQSHSSTTWQNKSLQAKSKAKQYSTKNWLNKVKNIANGKRILMVSDYTALIGGIELYMHDAGDILTKAGYQVQYFGLAGQVSPWQRKLYLPFTAYNIFYAKKLRKVIRDFVPNIIWLHSVSRFLGYKVLDNLDTFRGDVWMMYHDLGYFTPFPSQIYEQSQVDGGLSYSSFTSHLKTKNPAKRLAIRAKYFLLKKIRKSLLKNVDYHLVPSDFMVNILKSYGAKPDNIKVLEHFKTS